MTQSENWKAILDGKTLVNPFGKEVSLASDGTARTDGDIHKTMWNLESYTWKIKQDEPTYYYRYERLDDGMIAQTSLYSDEYAKEYKYTEENGWRKILSSKRTWDD